MGFDPLSALLDLGGKVLDRVIPDPVQRDAAKLELLKQAQAGELAEMQASAANALAQIDVNKVEAGSADSYTSRARPTVVYIAALSMLYALVVQPLVWPSHPLPAGTLEIMKDLVFGLMGLYVAGRSAEKIAATVKGPPAVVSQKD